MKPYAIKKTPSFFVRASFFVRGTLYDVIPGNTVFFFPIFYFN